MDNKLLTVKDLAIRLQLSVDVIYKLKAAGKLPPCLKIGGGIRWRPKAVEEWERGLEDK